MRTPAAVLVWVLVSTAAPATADDSDTKPSQSTTGSVTSDSLVIEAAEETRARIEEAGLNAFVKTSGGKGLHVVAPLKPAADWPEVMAFCNGIADAMA